MEHGSSWQPAHPFGIPRDAPLDDAPGQSGSVPWEDCPGTSHVHSFCYYDARQHGFLRKFAGPAGAGMSQLCVRFKDRHTGGPASEYVYFFANPDAGAAFAAKLRAAAHPGHVVNELIAAGVPYRKQGSFT